MPTEENKLAVFSHDSFMKEALKEANIAFDEQEVPVGAVVVLKNRIIARGYNQTERLNDVTAHAEMIAITSASNYLTSKYLSECTLYVTLEPCTMCASAIGWAQLGRIVYGVDDPKKGYSLVDANFLHPKAKVKRGVMKDECAELLIRFFEARR